MAFLTTRCVNSNNTYMCREGLGHTWHVYNTSCVQQRWQAYLKECVAFAVKHGGRLSLTQVNKTAYIKRVDVWLITAFILSVFAMQTRFVTREAFLSRPGQKPLPDTPNSRFTSAYFRQFI